MQKTMCITHGRYYNKKPDFFIIGTGKNYSVENFLDKTFKQLGLSYKKHLKIDKTHKAH